VIVLGHCPLMLVGLFRTYALTGKTNYEGMVFR